MLLLGIVDMRPTRPNLAVAPGYGSYMNYLLPLCKRARGGVSRSTILAKSHSAVPDDQEDALVPAPADDQADRFGRFRLKARTRP